MQCSTLFAGVNIHCFFGLALVAGFPGIYGKGKSPSHSHTSAPGRLEQLEE